MIQLLHDPSMPVVEDLLGAAFAGFLGLWALGTRILHEKKRDINHPEIFKSEMYAEDDIEEIVVEGLQPVPVAQHAPRIVTPPRVSFAVICLTIAAAGSWFGIRNLRILHDWDAGELCQARDDFSGAEQIYRAAEQIDPLVRKSHRLVADTLLQQHEDAKAIPELQKAASDEKTDASVHVVLGDALQSGERLAEAMKEYQQAIAIAPKLANTYIRMGSCLVKLNRLDDAGKEFQYAAVLDPKDAAAQTNLGCVLQMQGDTDGAILHLKRSIELAPRDAGVHNTLGTTYGRIGMYRESVAEFRAELAINPQFSIGYFNLGMSLAHMGDYHAAKDALTSYLNNTFSFKTQNPDAKIGVPKAFEELQKLHKLLTKPMPAGKMPSRIRPTG